MSMTWLQAIDTIRTARNQAAGKPVDNNTRLFQRGTQNQREFGIVLHGTEVVTIHADDTYTLRSGGYRTPTTADRIHKYSPAKQFSEKGEWFVWMKPTDRDPRPDRVEREVPKPFEASDPGEEPVKTTDDCVAGQMVTTHHINELVEIYRMDMKDDDEIVEVISESDSAVLGNRYDRLKVKRSWISHVYITASAHWDEGWANLFDNRNVHSNSFVNDDGEVVKRVQCVHCNAFDVEHEKWRYQMHGDRWHRRFDDPNKGFATYNAMMIRFHGNMDDWQKAYIEDFRARRAYLKADREWEVRNRVAFYDGITVDSEGYVPRVREKGPSPAKLRRHEREVAKIQKKIERYLDGYIKALVKGMPMPSNGDCWYCSMQTSDGVPLGDAAPTLYPDGSVTPRVNTEHLLSHMEEPYYVPSLVVNAMRETKQTDIGIYMLLDMNQDNHTMGGKPSGKVPYDMAKRAIRRYLRKRLVPEVPTS